MKKYSLVCFTIIFLIFFSHAAKRISAAELIVNGGFESTTAFQGWTVATAGSGWYPWQVTTAGAGDGTTGGISTSSPMFGTRSAWTGFCCNTTTNPEYIQQDVTIPTGQTASLIWWDKIQSNLFTYCTPADCGSNIWRVQILNTSNTVLQTLYTYTATYQTTTHNTGWRGHLHSLNAYAGQTIRIRFSGTYSSSLSGLYNGPGRAEVDGVSVMSPSATASEISIGGRVQTSAGSGVRNIAVFLSDANGNTRTTTTNSFGAYQFDGLQPGQTYFVSVSSKRYTFTNQMQTVTTNQSVSNVDFVSNE